MPDKELDPATHCTLMIHGYGPAGIPSRLCGRLLSDPCGPCKQFDLNKAHWDKIFEDAAGIRVTVEGDI